MGQYYKAMLQDEKGAITNFYPVWTKLMKHSWLHNGSMNYAMYLLEQKALHVWWVGDYADKEEVPADIYRARHSESENVETNDAWEEEWYKNYTTKGKFLVNITTGEFIDLDKYEDMAKDSEGYCVHPLSLLTAVGNGKGGGDYHEGKCMHLVGTWAGDLLKVTSERPDGLTELCCVFKEY